MSTNQQAAAQEQNSSELTAEEKARILELQQQIAETQKAASAPNPGGSPEYLASIPKESPNYRAYQSWLESKKQASEKLPDLQSQLSQITASRPELAAYAQSHPATQYELHEAGESLFGASAFQTITHNHRVQPTTDALKYQRLRGFAEQNPNASINDVVSFYQGSPLPQDNVTINYEGTLAARQMGYNVGSALYTGLPETFQKDENRRFAERNKQINLTENISTEKAKQVEQKALQPPTVTPQNPRPHILTGQPDSKYANADFAGNRQKSKTVELVENINAITGEPVSSAAPRAENLSGVLFGIAPKKPASLTQEQVNALSPAQYAEYKKGFENYNRYVTYYNEKIKQQNTANILVNREQFQRNREAFAKYISEAKAAGAQYVNIETKSGVQTIPIDQALQKKGVIGISAVPNIPEGFTAGYIAGELIAIPEGRQFVGPEKPIEQNYAKNIGDLFGAEALSVPKGFEKYQYEKGRVTSEKVPIPTQSYKSGPITTGIENLKSPLERGAEFMEGVGTGLLRTSLILTNAAPEAFMEIARTGNPLAGEDVLKRHEAELKRIGIGPSVVPSIESGVPTGRSAYYNAGELLGEVGPILIGIKGQIKNPFSRSPIKPKIPQTEAPEIAKTPSGIKGYPVAKLRDQGYGERPTLERGVIPKEEFNIKKSMNIPEPFVQEAGTTRGAKDYGNLREQIANVKKPLSETTEKPVELEPFYSPKVEIRRAPEPNTFRVDEKSMFGKDTASTIGKTEVPLGTSPLVKVEASRGPLGGSITKEVVTKSFVPENVSFGTGRIKEIRLNLGESKLGKVVKTKTPINQFDVKINEKEIPQTFEETISKSNPVEGDVFYKPTLPRTRAKEKGTYRVQTEKLIGRTENPLKDIYANMKEPSVLEGSKKPSVKQGIQKAELEKSFPQLMGKKSFERSAIDAEKRRAENIYKFTKTGEVNLGAGFVERVPARPPPYQHVGLGRGKTFFVSRSTGESGVKRFQPPKSPPPESRGGKGGQELLLEKPSETKGFTTTRVELGSTEKAGLVGAGGLAIAPAPLLIVAETDENGNPITNGTQTNGTSTNGTITNGTGTLPPIVNPPQEIDLTPSVLEPSSITETRPAAKFGGAVSTPSGLAYGLDALNARRSTNGNKIIVGPVTGTKQKQETFAGFPNPSKQPSRLAQPAAFRQPQKGREREIFGTPFPNPQTPALKSPTPFPQPEKLKQPEPLKQEPPKETIFESRFVKPRESRKEKARKDKLDAFVGNVSDVDIGLGFNRKEITPGIKASEKRYKKDTQFAYRRGGFKKLITQHEGSVLSKKKRSILEREKPKEVRKQKKKMGGFF